MTSKIGNCEVCEKADTAITVHYGNMWFCDDCWKLEVEATKVNTAPAAQLARVEESHNLQNTALEASRAIDANIQIRTDLFNAATVSIMELKKTIDDDTNITNKPYALASELMTRFEHYKQVVFELNQQLVDAGNNQKAIQIYLNNMANTLKAEEREKLKIQDLSYQPKPVKTPSVRQVKTGSTSKKVKIDKAELAKYVKEIGVSEFMFIQIINTRQCSVAEAAQIIRKSIEAAKVS